MPITPADGLDLRIANGPQGFNLGQQIAGIPGAYFAGLDQAYKQRQQDAFKNGVPKGPDGQPDWKAIDSTIIQQGGTGPALEVNKLGQQQELMRGLQGMSSGVFGAPDQQPAQGGTGLPPPTPQTPPQSISPVASPAVQRQGGDGGQTIMGAVGASFGDSQQAWRVAQAAAQKFGIKDVNATLSPEQFTQVQQYARAGASARQSPQATPAPTLNDRFPAPSTEGMASITNDPTLGGLVPRGRTAEQHLAILGKAAALAGATGVRDADKPYLNAMDAIQKRLQPTDEQKNYLAGKNPGETQSQWQARTAGEAESAKKFADIGSDMFDAARKGNDAAQTAMYRLDLIDHSINQLGPQGWMGTSATTRASIGKALNTAADAVLPPELAAKVKVNQANIANVEDFNKQTQTLGFELAKTLGSREAMMIVQQATNSVPNVNQSPLGAKLVSASLRQAAQRQQDYYEYLSKRPGQIGADVAFNKAHPPGEYARRAIAQSGIPVSKVGDQQSPPAPGAKQAKDGNWYLPDPNRPGKYLMVK